jgi:hypothetical protein
MQRGHAFFQRHRAVREIADAQHGRFKPGFAQKSSFHGGEFLSGYLLHISGSHKRHGCEWVQLGTAADSLAPPERGEGWGEGI